MIDLIKKKEYLEEYFNKHDFKHFFKITNKIDLNYSKYLKCFLKKDLYKIAKKTNVNIGINDSKMTIIRVLGKHFNTYKDGDGREYFLSKISKAREASWARIKYGVYLKTITPKNMAKISDMIYKKRGGGEENIDMLLDELKVPFNSVRKPRDLKNIMNQLQKYNSSEDIFYWFAQLNKFLQNEVISIKDIRNNLLKIKIVYPIKSGKISKMNNFSYSALYYGKIINGSYGGKADVVIKTQPKFTNNFLKISKKYQYQIFEEVKAMTQINKNCYGAIVSKIYAYGVVPPLKEGDIYRYVLVTERLGDDLNKLKTYPINKIKECCKMLLTALKTIHGCNLKNRVSLVHSDIKPDNIVFTDKSETSIKLIDFGITQNVLKYSRREDCVHFGGTYSYMSISQHKIDDPDYYLDAVVDYMDDFQAIAWMLLYFLDFEFKNADALSVKETFHKNYDNPLYINKILNRRLTKKNIHVIGTLCDYTIKRADKQNRYETDKKTRSGIYYSEYNEQYYSDLQNILDGLE